MSEASIMLVNGTSLSYRGSSVIDPTDEPITFVVGKGQMSLGSNNDVAVTVNKDNAGIKTFLPEDVDVALIKDTNGRTIESYNGKSHGSMGIMIDNKEDCFTLYADKGQYMLLTEDTSFVNPEQLMPTEIELADLGNGVGRLTASVLWDGALIDAEINGTVHKNISLPYEFEYGDRINDAIIKAGGKTENADVDRVNLAKHLIDGTEVVIPDISTRDIEDGEKININTANVKRLQDINGVGEATAEKIINYREESGGFNSIEEIMNIEGIGLKTFESMKDSICVN
jgi:comEA protein